MDIIWRAALGGIFIGIGLFLSRKFGPNVAGLAILFPFISLPIFYFIGTTEGMPKLRVTLLSSIAATPVWITFALAFYLAGLRFKLIPSLLIALGVWLAAALIFIFIREPHRL